MQRTYYAIVRLIRRKRVNGRVVGNVALRLSNMAWTVTE